MRKSKNRFFQLVLMTAFISLSLGLTGCAAKPKPPFEMSSPEMGMIYGNIHIPGHEATEIELREYDKFYLPPFVKTPRVMIFRNGDFIAENLAPGNYYISRFASNKLFYTMVKDNRSAYQNIITVEPGTINYVGSFEITNVRPGLFTKGDFKVRTVRHPSERKILKHMYKITQGTGWQTRVSHRIKSLR